MRTGSRCGNEPGPLQMSPGASWMPAVSRCRNPFLPLIERKDFP